MPATISLAMFLNESRHDHPVGSSSQDCPSAEDSTVAAVALFFPWLAAAAAALRQAPKGPWVPEGQGQPGVSSDT